MRSLTRAAYLVAGHAADLAAAVAPASDQKILRSLAARRGLVELWERWASEHRDVSRPLVWMHAPSVGEGLQARPVLELLAERHGDWQLVYTFFSPSAEAAAGRLAVDCAGYLPFDTPENAERMMAALRPSALVFAKLDVWPLLCEAAVRANVPLGLVSATVAPGSARRGKIAQAVLRDAYAAFDAVGAISDDHALRLVELGCKKERVRVTGDTRYDQVWARAQGVDRTSGLLRALLSPRPTLIAGSTWPADEAVLLRAWPQVTSRVADARLILAPHEPTPKHLLPIENWAQRSGLSLARLDSVGAASADVVLVNRVGVLGDLYALGTAAFVGGGFHAAGLHSVLEPAAFGLPVIFGPQHANSRDAGLLLDVDAGASVRTAPEARDAIVRWLGAEAALRGGQARSVVQGGLGASERAYSLVVDLVGRG